MLFFRRITALIIIFSFFMGIAYSGYVVLDYEINKEQVINEHCVNKTKPEMNCHGKCYLKKELKVEKEEKSTSKSFTSNYFFSFVFFQNLSEDFTFERLIKKEKIFLEQSLWSNIDTEIILSPPEIKA